MKNNFAPTRRIERRLVLLEGTVLPLNEMGMIGRIERFDPQDYVASAEGIEPPLVLLEGTVLPLNETDTSHKGDDAMFDKPAPAWCILRKLNPKTLQKVKYFPRRRPGRMHESDLVTATASSYENPGVQC